MGNARRIARRIATSLSESTIEFLGDTWSEETLNSMVGGGFFQKFRAWRREHRDVTDRDQAFAQFMRSEGYPDLDRRGR